MQSRGQQRWYEEPSTASSDDPLDVEGTFVLEVRTGGDEAGGECHHLRVGPGGHRFAAGPAPRPDVWLAIDEDVAEALRAGTLSLAAAVQAGRVRVGGDLAGLLAHQEALAEVARRVAGVVRS